MRSSLLTLIGRETDFASEFRKQLGRNERVGDD